MFSCNKVNLLSLECYRGNRIFFWGGGGGRESQKTIGVKMVYFVFVFLFNCSMIMLRGSQVTYMFLIAFYMFMTC